MKMRRMLLKIQFVLASVILFSNSLWAQDVPAEDEIVGIYYMGEGYRWRKSPDLFGHEDFTAIVRFEKTGDKTYQGFIIRKFERHEMWDIQRELGDELREGKFYYCDGKHGKYDSKDLKSPCSILCPKNGLGKEMKEKFVIINDPHVVTWSDGGLYPKFWNYEGEALNLPLTDRLFIHHDRGGSFVDGVWTEKGNRNLFSITWDSDSGPGITIENFRDTRDLVRSNNPK